MIINKKYSIIYADPPWFYNGGRKENHKFGGGPRAYYDLMSFQDIYNLPIKEIADENCVLMIWATFPCLPEAIKTIEAWGFKYKTVGFTWVKTNKKTVGKMFLTKKDVFFGVGYYTKSNAEVCLLATKGKMKPISNKISSVILEPLSRHSEKPKIIRDKIVELFGDLPRIELFARDKAQGWDSWGNQLDGEQSNLSAISEAISTKS